MIAYIRFFLYNFCRRLKYTIIIYRLCARISLFIRYHFEFYVIKVESKKVIKEIKF